MFNSKLTIDLSEALKVKTKHCDSVRHFRRSVEKHWAGRRGNGAAQGAETVAPLSDLFRGYSFVLACMEVLLNLQPSHLPPVFRPGGGGPLNGSDVSAAADMCPHHPIA